MPSPNFEASALPEKNVSTLMAVNHPSLTVARNSMPIHLVEFFLVLSMDAPRLPGLRL